MSAFLFFFVNPNATSPIRTQWVQNVYSALFISRDKYFSKRPDSYFRKIYNSSSNHTQLPSFGVSQWPASRASFPKHLQFPIPPLSPLPLPRCSSPPVCPSLSPVSPPPSSFQSTLLMKKEKNYSINSFNSVARLIYNLKYIPYIPGSGSLLRVHCYR